MAPLLQQSSSEVKLQLSVQMYGRSHEALLKILKHQPMERERAILSHETPADSDEGSHVTLPSTKCQGRIKDLRWDFFVITAVLKIYIKKKKTFSY